jgi:aldehyde:ferredoxin oxidoreductase
VIACGRVVRLEDGKKRKGPEYETIAGFGPNLLIDDLERITQLGELCDRYGMDSISMSNTIGMAFSLFEKGIITEKDTHGLSLNWGDADNVTELVSLTARKKGFGDILAKGALDLGRHFGVEDQAVQVNGLELAYHDPRGASGMGLVYATSPRGACHNQSDYYLADLMGHVEDSLGMEYFDRHAGAEKALNVAIHQDWRTVFNSLVLCYFANVEPQKVVDLTNAATEEDYTIQSLLQVGERAWNLKRVINHRLGLTRNNDKLPKPIIDPYDEGGSAGYQLPFDDMLMAYYEARDWDSSTGQPNIKKLKELGLEWVSLTA